MARDVEPKGASEQGNMLATFVVPGNTAARPLLVALGNLSPAPTPNRTPPELTPSGMASAASDDGAEYVLRVYKRPPRTRSARGATGRGSEGLTGRQIQVLDCAIEGLTREAIARRLGISPRTVDTHFTNIFQKLGVHDRAAAVALAMSMGLVRGPRPGER